MSQTKYTLKDLFYFVTILCVLAAVCQVEGGGIVAGCALLASWLVVVWLRNVGVRQVRMKLGQILQELWQLVRTTRISRRDLFHYFVLFLVLVGVSIVEQGYVIASFAVVTSVWSIFTMRFLRGS